MLSIGCMRFTHTYETPLVPQGTSCSFQARDNEGYDDWCSVSSTQFTVAAPESITALAIAPSRTHYWPTTNTQPPHTTATTKSLPAFILLIGLCLHYAATIVFLSFALARQVFIPGSYFGSQIVVVRIEVVHHRLNGVGVRAQEKWIKRGWLPRWMG